MKLPGGLNLTGVAMDMAKQVNPMAVADQVRKRRTFDHVKSLEG